MISALLLLALAASPARAGTPPTEELLPITQELLDRWGVSEEHYVALDPDAKVKLQRDLTHRERRRLRRVQLLRRVFARDCRRKPSPDCPDGWTKLLDAKGLLTAAGDKLVDGYVESLRAEPLVAMPRIHLQQSEGLTLTDEDFALARRRLDRAFDGFSDNNGFGSDLTVNARVRNETLYNVTATDPHSGLSLEVGQLGVDGRHPLMSPSWYENITGRWDSKPSDWVDYRLRASLGYMQLTSRVFNDEPAPDPSVDRALALGQGLGLPTDQAASHLHYSDPYVTHAMPVASLLTEFGRAYNLFGPVDLSWTVGNLSKLMYLAPNTAFDETLGVRVKLPEWDVHAGIFGGAIENISPVGSHLLQEAMTTGTVTPGVNVEVAPHATIALWGRIPGVENASFLVSGSQRWNQDTTVQQVQADVMTSFFSHPLTVGGSYSRERGDAIEFDREKARLQADYRFADQASAYVAFERDRIIYGNATVESNAFLAGLDIGLGGGSSVTMDHLFGGRYEDRSAPLRPYLQDTLTRINGDVAAGLDAVDKANQLYRLLRGSIDPAQLDVKLNDLSLSFSRLDAGTVSQVINQLGGSSLTDEQKQLLGAVILKTAAPGTPFYNTVQGAIANLRSKDGAVISDAQNVLNGLNKASDYFATHKGELRELLGLLTDEKVWDAALVQAGRAELLSALRQNGKVHVSVLGQRIAIDVDAPALLAAANILQSRLSPLAPVRQSEIEPWLRTEAAKALGLDPANASNDAIMNQLFGMADTQIKTALQQSVAPALANLTKGLQYDEAAVAAQVLAALPPGAAAALKARYGPNLQGLLPPVGTAADQVRAFLLTQLPDTLMAFLKQQYGPTITQGIGQAVSWAGDVLRREINMTLIQLLLASEELNRLTVDHGEKIGDLDVRMAMASFDSLDERGRQDASRRLRAATESLAQETGRDEAALADKFAAYGRASLEELETDPSWPQGLRVAVDDKSWVAILTYYGDGAFFALLERIKTRYAAAPHPHGAAVTFDFDDHDNLGTMIRSEKDSPSVRFTLCRPRDPRDGRFRLARLADYLPH